MKPGTIQRVFQFKAWNSIHFYFKTPNKQMLVYFRTRPGKCLIWQKNFYNVTVLIKIKQILFSLLVGDRQVKRCSGFITAIHNWFSESAISDLVFSVNLTSIKSIDEAFKGKHYRRSLRKLHIWSNLTESDQSMGW